MRETTIESQFGGQIKGISQNLQNIRNQKVEIYEKLNSVSDSYNEVK